MLSRYQNAAAASREYYWEHGISGSNLFGRRRVPPSGQFTPQVVGT
jgi:hypothetical protein